MAGLDLLQADHVPRLGAGEPAREALALGGADAVDVERDDAQAILRPGEHAGDGGEKAASVHDARVGGAHRRAAPAVHAGGGPRGILATTYLGCA